MPRTAVEDMVVRIGPNPPKKKSISNIPEPSQPARPKQSKNTAAPTFFLVSNFQRTTGHDEAVSLGLGWPRARWAAVVQSADFVHTFSLEGSLLNVRALGDEFRAGRGVSESCLTRGEAWLRKSLPSMLSLSGRFLQRTCVCPSSQSCGDGRRLGACLANMALSEFPSWTNLGGRLVRHPQHHSGSPTFSVCMETPSSEMSLLDVFFFPSCFPPTNLGPPVV